MITPTQSLMARAALRWSLHDLAEAADIAVSTVRRSERGEVVASSTEKAIEQAFANHGVRFNPDGSVTPPARLGRIASMAT
jgi:transcriptional regulator with XRE-family HTH domain